MKELNKVFNEIRKTKGKINTKLDFEDRAKIEACSTFYIYLVAEVIAYIISNIEKKEFRKHFTSTDMIIASTDRKEEFYFTSVNNRCDITFYRFGDGQCQINSDLNNIPYSYIIDFINFAISYRIKYGIKEEITRSELYLIAELFLSQIQKVEKHAINENYQELHFINKLSDEDIMVLINRCIDEKNRWYKEAGSSYVEPPIDTIQKSDETDRRDMNGNRYILVDTATGPRINDTFIIYDFNMQTTGNNSMGFSHILKRFLTETFGENYLKSLEAKRQIDTQLEIEELKQYLPRGLN